MTGRCWVTLLSKHTSLIGTRLYPPLPSQPFLKFPPRGLFAGGGRICCHLWLKGRGGCRSGHCGVAVYGDCGGGALDDRGGAGVDLLRRAARPLVSMSWGFAQAQSPAVALASISSGRRTNWRVKNLGSGLTLIPAKMHGGDVAVR